MGSPISGSMDFFQTNTAKTDGNSSNQEEEALSEESGGSCYSEKVDVGSDENVP